MLLEESNASGTGMENPARNSLNLLRSSKWVSFALQYKQFEVLAPPAGRSYFSPDADAVDELELFQLNE